MNIWLKITWSDDMYVTNVDSTTQQSTKYDGTYHKLVDSTTLQSTKYDGTDNQLSTYSWHWLQWKSTTYAYLFHNKNIY